MDATLNKTILRRSTAENKKLDAAALVQKLITPQIVCSTDSFHTQQWLASRQKGAATSAQGVLTTISAQRLAFLKDMFNMLDLDGGGTIGLGEIRAVFAELPLGDDVKKKAETLKQIMAVFKALDRREEHGDISFMQWVQVMASQAPGRTFMDLQEQHSSKGNSGLVYFCSNLYQRELLLRTLFDESLTPLKRYASFKALFAISLLEDVRDIHQEIYLLSKRKKRMEKKKLEEKRTVDAAHALNCTTSSAVINNMTPCLWDDIAQTQQRRCNSAPGSSRQSAPILQPLNKSTRPATANTYASGVSQRRCQSAVNVRSNSTFKGKDIRTLQLQTNSANPELLILHVGRRAGTGVVESCTVDTSDYRIPIPFSNTNGVQRGNSAYSSKTKGGVRLQRALESHVSAKLQFQSQHTRPIR